MSEPAGLQRGGLGKQGTAYSHRVAGAAWLLGYAKLVCKDARKMECKLLFPASSKASGLGNQ